MKAASSRWELLQSCRGLAKGSDLAKLLRFFLVKFIGMMLAEQ